MKKRILSLTLAAIMLIGLLAACSTNAPSAVSPSSETDSAFNVNPNEPDTSPITISILNRLPATFVLENNHMLEALTEATGVTLDIDAPPIANFSDRLQLVMASGDIPDIIYTWEFDANYEKWAAEGLIYKLDEEMLSQYPNLMANINEDQWKRARVGSMGEELYAIPRSHPKSRWAVIVNEEWMEKLNTAVPTTTQELYEVAKLIASGDPDENGRVDTFLFSPTGLWTDCWLIGGFMPFSTQHAQSYLPDPVDGKYKLKEKMTGYFPYLDFMRKLYEEKLMDPEWFTNNLYDDRTKFQQERVGFLHNSLAAEVGWVSGIPNALEKYSSYPGMVMDGHDKYRNEIKVSTWGGWMINADVDEAKLKRILSLLDWANSPEGFTLMAVGVQGTDYETYDLETRTVVRSEDQTKNVQGQTSGYMNFANAYMGEIAIYANDPELSKLTHTMNEEYDAAVETVEIPVVKIPEIDNWPAENPDIATKKEELEVKYVCGEISREVLEDFFNNEYFPSIEAAEKIYIETMETYVPSHNS